MRKIKHIFFGDSLTSCDNLKKNKQWVYAICAEINKKYKDIILYEVINKGTGGENTRQALERMQNDVQNSEPNILTIQFGTNDSDYWLSNQGLPCVSLDAFFANICEMIDRANVFGIKNIILHTNHLFLFNRIEINNKTHSENIIPYNQIIRNIAKLKKCHLIDIEKILQSTHPSNYCLPLPDGIHLNENGCQEYLKAVKPIIENIVENILNLEKK